MNPKLGIFGSLDPLEGQNQMVGSLNRYNWVRGNVANLRDASGMSPMCQGVSQTSNPSSPNNNNSYKSGAEKEKCYIECISNPFNYMLGGYGVDESCRIKCYPPQEIQYSDYTSYSEFIQASTARWNRINPADCLNPNGCVTLSPEEFAATLAAIIQTELPDSISMVAYESLGNTNFLYLGADSSLGPVNLRPSSVNEIIGGYLSSDTGVNAPRFDTSRLPSNLVTEWNAIQGDGLATLTFLEEPSVAVELAAANLYRGIIRTNNDGQSPTMFSLSTWHNAGVYSSLYPQLSESTINKANAYGETEKNSNDYSGTFCSKTPVEDCLGSKSSLHYANEVMGYVVHQPRSLPWMASANSPFAFYNSAEAGSVSTTNTVSSYWFNLMRGGR